MATVSDTAIQPARPRSSVWARIASFDALKVLAGLAALAGLVFHLVGSVWYDEYLRSWGLDAALFPKSADRLIIAGYETVLTSSLQLWPAAIRNIAYVALMSLALSCYWEFLSVVSDRMSTSSDAPRWLARWPRVLRSIFARFVVLTSLSVVVPVIVYFLGLLLAGPVALAATSAQTHVRSEITRFGEGCQQVGPLQCFELKRGGDVARGFLIDSSPDNIAFYDVTLRRARVIARAGSEMLGRQVPSAAVAAASTTTK